MLKSLWATILFGFVLFVFNAYHWTSALYIESSLSATLQYVMFLVQNWNTDFYITS